MGRSMGEQILYATDLGSCMWIRNPLRCKDRLGGSSESFELWFRDTNCDWVLCGNMPAASDADELTYMEFRNYINPLGAFCPLLMFRSYCLA